MRIKQFQHSNEKQPANNTHVKFAPDENATCSPDPCRSERFLNADDVTQLAGVFGVTQLFEAINTYYAKEFIMNSEENSTSSPDPKKWNITSFDLQKLGFVYGVEHLLNSIDKIYEGYGRYETRVALTLYGMCKDMIDRRYCDLAKDEHLAQCVENVVFAMLENHSLVAALDQLIAAYTKYLTFAPDTCLVAVLFMQIYRTNKLIEKDTK